MALGCAVDAGKTAEYHSGVFAMQPSKEGDGFTDQQLLDLGKKLALKEIHSQLSRLVLVLRSTKVGLKTLNYMLKIGECKELLLSSLMTN